MRFVIALMLGNFDDDDFPPPKIKLVSKTTLLIISSAEKAGTWGQGF